MTVRGTRLVILEAAGTIFSEPLTLREGEVPGVRF